jgi:hypothetical protein
MPASAEASAGPPGDDVGGASPDVPWEVEKGPFDQSPELFAAAAFVGGFLVARLVRRFGNG